MDGYASRIESRSEEMQDVVAMADSASFDLRLATPLAQIHPSIDADGTYIIGLVTLIWPYSISRKELSLLLVEPDFRLRRNKGQARIIFKGASAKAIARSGINSGDKLLLALDGTRYERAETTIATPGRGVEWDLHFGEVLRFRVERQDQEVLSVTVDHPPSTPTSSPIPTDPTRDLPSAGDCTTQSKDGNGAQEWDSPAFLKRKRISSLPYFESSYDPFSSGVDTDAQPSPKKSKFGRKSNEWKFAERTPSPEEAADNEQRTPHSDGTSAVEVAMSPTAGANAAYITAPPSDEDGLVHEGKESVKGVSRGVLSDARDSAMNDATEVSEADTELIVEPSMRQTVQKEMQGDDITFRDGDEASEKPMEKLSKPCTDSEKSLKGSRPSKELLAKLGETVSELSEPAHSLGQFREDVASDDGMSPNMTDQEESPHADPVVRHIQVREQETVGISGLPPPYNHQFTADLGQETDTETLSTAVVAAQRASKSLGYGLDGTSFSRLQSEQRSASPSASTGSEGRDMDWGRSRADANTETHDSDQVSAVADPVLGRDRGLPDRFAQDRRPDEADLLTTDRGRGEDRGEAANSVDKISRLGGAEQKYKINLHGDSSHSSPNLKEAPNPSILQEIDGPRLKMSAAPGLSNDTNRQNLELLEVRNQEDADPSVGSILEISDESSTQITVEESASEAASAVSERDYQDIPFPVEEADLNLPIEDLGHDRKVKGDSEQNPDESPQALESASQALRDDVPQGAGTLSQPPQETRPPLQSAKVEIIDLEDGFEDDGAIMKSLRGSYLHPATPREGIMESERKEPQPDEGQEEKNAMRGHLSTSGYIRKETTGDSADRSDSSDHNLFPDEMINYMRDGSERPSEEQTYEVPAETSQEAVAEVSEDHSAQPLPEANPFTSFDLADDFPTSNVRDEFRPYDPDGSMESKLEPSGQIDSSPPPFIPEDDFLDVTHYSDHYEEYPATQEGVAQHTVDRSSEDALSAGEDRPPLPESLVSISTLHKDDTATEAPVIDEHIGKASPAATKTEMEIGTLGTSQSLASTTDIPIDPSLLTKTEAKAHIPTPATTQRTEPSQLSLRPLSPPPPHLPTPSLTQSASSEQLPGPKTAATPRTSNVIEKLKSRSREKWKKRTSDIAPVISRWFEPKRSSQIIPSREKSPSPRSSHQLSQVFTDVEETSSSQVIPDSEGERQEEESEADDQILYSDEEMTAPDKVAQKSRQSPSVVVSPGTSGAQSSYLSTSLPGLRTPLSYFAPLSTLYSHFSISISTLSIIVSSTKPERATKGPRDYTMTLYLSDPSLHQQQSSSPPSTPYFKPSESSSTVTAMLFRPHLSALPTLQVGDAILLRNFKVTSLKGKMGLTSTESSAWAVFQRDRGWEPSVRGPPVEFGPEERAYASGLGRWWGSVKGRYEHKAKGKGKAVPLSSLSTTEPPLRHELRDGKEYVDDPSTIEEAKSERRDRRQSTHKLRDGYKWRDDA